MQFRDFFLKNRAVIISVDYNEYGLNIQNFGSCFGERIRRKSKAELRIIVQILTLCVGSTFGIFVHILYFNKFIFNKLEK